MSLEGLRVLVVEDELLVAMEIEVLLTDLGCAIVGPVASVDEALRLIDKEPIDGALLDVNLYGGYSYAAAEALSARAVPFVFLTGYTGLPHPPPALQGTPCLSKPFTQAQLATAMRAAFKGPR